MLYIFMHYLYRFRCDIKKIAKFMGAEKCNSVHKFMEEKGAFPAVRGKSDYVKCLRIHVIKNKIGNISVHSWIIKNTEAINAILCGVCLFFSYFHYFNNFLII
jgi:hypothetical protein